MARDLVGASLLCALLGVVLMLLYWFWRYVRWSPTRSGSDFDSADPLAEATARAGEAWMRGYDWAVRATGWAGRALLIVAVVLALIAAMAAALDS